MRIDRFLFFARLAKSRSLAQAIVETGRMRIDSRRVEKPSAEVRVGSIVALPGQGRVRILRVTGLPARRGPAREAHACYEELTETKARLSEVAKGSAYT